MSLIFRRGADEVRLEIRDEIATAELLVVCHQPNGTTTTERFNDHAALRGYLTSFESRMLADNWQRLTAQSEGTHTVQVPKDWGGSVSRVPTPAPRPVAAPPPPLPPPVPMTPQAAPAPASPPATAQEADGENAANQAGVYTLESPALCPHCHESLDTMRVLRLSRAQVAFTSALPRGGRALVCPRCNHILSAELAGLI